MGWSIGYDSNWKRDIGYGVPAFCDHPGCKEEIDRGLSYVCGDEPYGGEHGCGLYFCDEHHRNWAGEGHSLCNRCGNYKPPYKRISPEHPEWLWFKVNDDSWAEWRKENPVEAKFAAENSRPMREAWKDSDETDEPGAASPELLPTQLGKEKE